MVLQNSGKYRAERAEKPEPSNATVIPVNRFVKSNLKTKHL